MSTYPVEFKQLEEENQRLQAENERLRVLLIDAEPRWAISNWLEQALNRSQKEFESTWL